MSLFMGIYRIETDRLRGHDYAAPGGYFITICTVGMNNLFGEIRNRTVCRNELGEIAHKFWIDIPQHHANVSLDEFIIMPNHVHGILVLHPLRRDVACNVSTRNPASFMSSISPRPGTLGAIVRSYKAAVTRWQHNRNPGDAVWGSRFYDHVIRNKSELFAIRNYIRNNPGNWSEADSRPMNLSTDSCEKS
jgi:REP element-mobilizing transposase RayT